LVSTDVASQSQSEPDSEAPIFAVLRSSSGNWRCPRHRLGESWLADQAHDLSRLQDTVHAVTRYVFVFLYWFYWFCV